MARTLKEIMAQEKPEVVEKANKISEFELPLLKNNAFQQQLGGFSRWEQENVPAETDLAALENNLEA